MSYSQRLLDYINNGDILYSHQDHVLENMAGDMDAGHTGGVILAPTGIGKTIIMGAAIKAIGERTLVLVPRKVLADQTFDAFTEVVGIDANDIGVYHSDVSASERRTAPKKKVLITTPSSYMNMVKRGEISPSDFGYACIDEAHRARGRLIKTAMSELIEHTMVHAWTATDTFTDGTTVGQILFGRDDYVFELGFKEAVVEGFLAPVKNIILRTGIDASKIGSPHKELTEAQQKTLAMRKGRDEIAIDHSLNFTDPATGITFKDQVSVWYCSGVNHAHNVARNLNQAHGEGYAVVVSGQTPKKELKRILADHKQGKFKAIINADLLIEGWDNPKVSIAYMLRDTVSPIVTMQTGGRAVRIDKDNPDKLAYIVNLMDSGRPYARTFADVAGGLIITGKKGSVGFEDDSKKPKDAGEKAKVNYDDIDTSSVIITEEDYRLFLRERKEELKEIDLPEKTSEWKTKKEFARSVGTTPNNPAFISLWEEVEKTGKIDGNEIRSGKKKSGSLSPFCVHEDEADIFKQKLGLDIEEKTPEWKTKTKFGGLLGVNRGEDSFISLWEEVEKTGKIDGNEIRSGKKKSGSHSPFCVHEDEADIFKQKLGLDIEEKTSEWKTKTEFGELLRIAPQKLAFISLWEEVEKAGKIDGNEIRSGKKKSGNHSPFCVHEDEADIFKQKLGLDIEEKTSNWKAKQEFVKLLGVTPQKLAFVSLWEEVEKAGKIDGNEIRSGKKKSGNHSPFCVHEDEADIFKQKLGLDIEEKTSEWKARKEFSKLLGISEENPAFISLWDEVGKIGKIDGNEIRSGKKRSGGHFPLCVHEDEADIFKQKLGLDIEEKTSEWKTKEEFSKLLGVNRGNDSFISLWEEVEKIGKIDGNEIRSGKKKSGSHSPFCVHEDEADIFKQKLGLDIEEKTSEWKAKYEFAKLVRIAPNNPAFISLWEEVEKTGKIDEDEIRSGKKRSGGHSPPCVHESEVDNFREELASRKAAAKGQPSGKAQTDSIEVVETKSRDSSKEKS